MHDASCPLSLTMTKKNISMKNENDALLLGTCIKDDIENTIVKNGCNNSNIDNEN
jgi:hypothetical protein